MNARQQIIHGECDIAVAKNLKVECARCLSDVVVPVSGGKEAVAYEGDVLIRFPGAKSISILRGEVFDALFEVCEAPSGKKTSSAKNEGSPRSVRSRRKGSRTAAGNPVASPEGSAVVDGPRTMDTVGPKKSR